MPVGRLFLSPSMLAYRYFIHEIGYFGFHLSLPPLRNPFLLLTPAGIFDYCFSSDMGYPYAGVSRSEPIALTKKLWITTAISCELNSIPKSKDKIESYFNRNQRSPGVFYKAHLRLYALLYGHLFSKSGPSPRHRGWEPWQ